MTSPNTHIAVANAQPHNAKMVSPAEIGSSPGLLSRNTTAAPNITLASSHPVTERFSLTSLLRNEGMEAFVSGYSHTG